MPGSLGSVRSLIAAITFLLLAACTSADEGETPPSSLSPAETTQAWLDALSSGEYALMEQLVEPTGLAIIAAVESNLRSDELAGLLESGFTDELRAQYWSTFADSFALFRGEPIGAVAVGDEIALAGVAGHAAVALETDSATGSVILREMPDGWRIDFAATVGPALIGPLGEYLGTAITGEHAAVISSAYGAAVVPGLEAALALDQDNSALVFEAEYIRQLAAATP